MSRKINILLVEDEVIVAMFMQKQLRDIGYQSVHHVTTGEKAIIYIQDNTPDIILMDIRLAGEIDGIETAGAIKAKADIPILFITGYDDKDIREKALKVKPVGFLVKPIYMHTLKKYLPND